MTRKAILTLALACTSLGVQVGGVGAIVGGHNTANGAYPSIARVSFGSGFLCTGTLIAPTWVLTAGHCGSVTGATGAQSPAAWPPALITVRIGGDTQSGGEQVPVSQAIVHPNHLLGDSFDVTLLQLTRASLKAPTKVAGTTEGSLWSPGTSETIVGWGTTSEGGSLPSHLQEAKVPITTDAYCTGAYGSSFEKQTMICAGFPQGGVDTCQGDSGGPMFGKLGTALKVVGTTSWGEGCARPGKPGVYARVADTTLREWIRSQVPAGVD